MKAVLFISALGLAAAAAVYFLGPWSQTAGDWQLVSESGGDKVYWHRPSAAKTVAGKASATLRLDFHSPRSLRTGEAFDSIVALFRSDCLTHTVSTEQVVAALRGERSSSIVADFRGPAAAAIPNMGHLAQAALSLSCSDR